VKLKFFLIVIAFGGTLLAQMPGTEPDVPKPGVKEVQVPFTSLVPSATFKIGETADWVVVTKDAVWVAGSKPYSLQHIDPASNRVVAKVDLPGEACSGLEEGFGSIWVPICAKEPALVKVDEQTNKVTATFPIGPAGPEGGIAASSDSIWMVTDERGTLSRIDPATGKVRQKISILPSAYNPVFSDGVVWITGVESGVLVAVDASSGEVVASIPVGPKPRFLTAGAGSVWTLNQGDGSVSRVDIKSKKLAATIGLGIRGTGGDICYGADSVWASVFQVPLTRIEPGTNKVVRQWVGDGGDSLRFGYDSIWLTDYHKGLLQRFPHKSIVQR
jgi:virginiamycin B lyase